MRAPRRVLLPLVALMLLVGAGLFPKAAVADDSTETAPPRHQPVIYPTVEGAQAQRAAATGRAGAASVVGPQLNFQGGKNGIGVTTGAPQVYLVFWGSQWGTATPAGSTNYSGDPSHIAPRVQAMLAGIGTNNELWSGATTEYCEGVPVGTTLCPVSAPHVGYPTGGALAGFWEDTSTSAPPNASFSQIASEAVRTAQHFGNTTAASNRNTQYVVVSPTGTHPDGFNTPNGHFCAWHDYIGAPTSSYGDLAYTNLPYVPDMGASCGKNFVNAGTAGDLDGVTMVEGHEYAETITDQLPAGGWIDENGNENADKCAWLKGTTGGAQNVTFGTGTFAMQGTWSNDGRTCSIAHAIWGIDGPDDFSIDVGPRSGFTAPGGDVTTTITSATVVGNPQNIDWSASSLTTGATVDFAPSSMSSDGTTTATIHTAPGTPDGQYTVTFTATGASVTRSIDFGLVVLSTPPVALQNGVPITGLSGGLGSDKYFVLDIPDATHETDWTIAGGTGVYDIYAAQDSLPTDSDYFCSNTYSTPRSCHIWGISGRWYLRVHATTAYSGATLLAVYGSPQRLISGQIVRDVSGTAGSVHYYWIRVLGAHPHRISFKIGNATGDADLYGRYWNFPSPYANMCPKLPKQGRHAENCQIKNPISTSVYYFAVYGATDYTGLRVSVVVS
jgi:serine protease